MECGSPTRRTYSGLAGCRSPAPMTLTRVIGSYASLRSDSCVTLCKTRVLHDYLNIVCKLLGSGMASNQTPLLAQSLLPAIPEEYLATLCGHSKFLHAAKALYTYATWKNSTPTNVRLRRVTYVHAVRPTLCSKEAA